jgi:ubiquinone/menaquinone biosynthesis C-methylase UbiE
MAKIEPFEKYEEQFEDWYERNKLTYESELKAIKEQLPKSNNGIEIGVGTGRFAAPLGIKVGVEPSGKMSAIAQQRGIKVVGGVAEALPFDDSQFDFALMVTTICFLDNIEIAFKEVYRVLKPNGCLVIGFIDKDSPIGKLYNQHKEDNVFYKIATFYSIKEVISCLKRAGFKDFNFIQTIFHEIAEIKDVEPIKDGYGEGSFVVIKAMN